MNDGNSTTLHRWTRPKLPRPISKVSKAWDSRLRRSRFHGWRMGVLFGCCMSFLVLCCNIALIAIGANSKSGYDHEGISSILEGDEALISRWDSALHVLINVLSTALLSSSNYTMQVLSSPTRKDLDAAHAKGQWLDIGRLSPRNLRAISRSRATLWLILVLSSTPLHLFYNASIFKVITSRKNYDFRTLDVSSEAWKQISDATDNSTWTHGEYWNLPADRWDEPYTKEHVSVHGDLYLAIDRVSIDLSSPPLDLNFSQITAADVETWTTADRSTPKTIIVESPEWLNYNSLGPQGQQRLTGAYLHVAKASSWKGLDTPSTVRVSIYFLVVVVSFNLVKLIILLTVLLTDRSEYLVTLGDAASSFLKREDPHTISRCLLSRECVLLSLGHPVKERKYDETDGKELNLRLRGVWLPRSRSYFSPFHDRAQFIYIFS
ncbi:hypothetical protein BKA58DRAFT_321608 [Alternaria rosae]|uniref:uncharacterized protein n=1 Tax=Alternaria rosae TaxID=1187941 RepID=UPI001E8D7208|nr:uncharacterized protein BKA58DRAFT_321608 [Alternaria rosae]KAH6865333.1 hypothetical protein BKA58DRAFT_321608 [Alternaria rosae]